MALCAWCAGKVVNIFPHTEDGEKSDEIVLESFSGVVLKLLKQEYYKENDLRSPTEWGFFKNCFQHDSLSGKQCLLKCQGQCGSEGRDSKLCMALL